MKRGPFRADDPHAEAANADFARQRPKALERDGHACRWCGWRLEGAMEVHHLDDDHANNALANLATACRLCHGACHVGFQGASGRAELCHFAPMADVPLGIWHQAQRALRYSALLPAPEGLRERQWREYVETMPAALLEAGRRGAVARLGHSDAAHFGAQLAALGDADYARRGEVLAGFCLWYAPEAYDRELEAMRRSGRLDGLREDALARASALLEALHPGLEPGRAIGAMLVRAAGA